MNSNNNEMSDPGTDHQVSFKLPPVFNLAIDWIIFTCQVLSILGNGFIIYLFIIWKIVHNKRFL